MNLHKPESLSGVGCDGEKRSRIGRPSLGIGVAWLGLLGLVVAGNLGEYWWWFDLAAHFRVQYFVVALGLCGVALLTRCWKWALASLGLATVLGATLLPFWSGTVRLPAGSERLRVLSVNVLSSNSRPDLLGDVIAVEQPDLVVLLEYSPEWDEALRWMEADYPHRILEPRRGNFGMAIFSRRPLSRRRVMHLGEGGPLCLAVDVDLAARPLTVWGVHTYPPVSREASAARNMHMASLAQLVCDDQADCVVVGDLNCTSWSRWFVNFSAETGLYDSRLGWGVQATWPAEWVWGVPLRVPIDHCLLSPSVGVAARHVTAGIGSDHFGVVADLGWVDLGWVDKSGREAVRAQKNSR